MSAQDFRSEVEGLTPEMQRRALLLLAGMVGDAERDRALEYLRMASRFRDYLSADEARMVVDTFISAEGTQGPRWPDSDALFRRATELGIPCEVDGQYNRWAFFAVTNMMQSDYGAVLRQYVDGDKLPRLCLQLAQAYLCDPDRPEGATIRRYLEIE